MNVFPVYLIPLSFMLESELSCRSLPFFTFYVFHFEEKEMATVKCAFYVVGQ